jgi:hypothetical protein
MMACRIATELDNRAVGDGRVSLVVVDGEPMLDTNGGLFAIDVTGGGRHDTCSLRSAAESLRSTPSAIRTAIEAVYPDASGWDWAAEMQDRGTIELGRDGLGDGIDDAMFARWVAYVCRQIDAAVGFEVDVDVVAATGDQTRFLAADPDDVRAMREGLEAVWAMWCRGGAP